MRALYAELLALRRELPHELEADVDERGPDACAAGGAELHADFGNLDAWSCAR